MRQSHKRKTSSTKKSKKKRVNLKKKKVTGGVRLTRLEGLQLQITRLGGPPLPRQFGQSRRRGFTEKMVPRRRG